MTFETIRNIFAWSLTINLALIILWFILVSVASDWIYKMHSKCFKLSRESFYSIHYGGILFFKLLIIVFNLVPYIAMHIAG